MAHRYRLMPVHTQSAVLSRHCADARYVWNLALEQANLYRPGRRTPSSAERFRQLAEARQHSWLGEGSSSIQQQALRDFDQALKNWWTHPAHFGRPTWRRAGVHEGFCIRDIKVRRLNHRWGEVMVPKLGPVRFIISRPIPGVRSARVTLDRAGRWHVSFTAPQPPLERTATGSGVGLDMGVATTVTTSDGAHRRMPPLLSAGQAQRKRRLQRHLARQQKGSRRRERTRTALARLAATEADRRKDWIEKTTTTLVRGHDLICLEDLKVKNMTRSAKGTVERPGRNVRQKAGLNRAITSQAWALFRQRLCDKAAAATDPVTVVAINPACTSQRCSACGHTAPENRESQAAFCCQACGHTDNADVNAAVNILAAGLAVTARGGTSHVPPPGADETQRPDEARTRPVAA